jgi:hypothetical protein
MRPHLRLKKCSNTDMEFRASINRLLPGQKLAPMDSRWGNFNSCFRVATHTPESLLGKCG